MRGGARRSGRCWPPPALWSTWEATSCCRRAVARWGCRALARVLAAGVVAALAAAAAVVCARPHLLPPATSLQNATWALGAPLVAMLYGLRVVAAIAEQQLMLGTTVLAAQPALQASGVCLAVVSVSLYMYAAWRRSRNGLAL